MLPTLTIAAKTYLVATFECALRRIAALERGGTERVEFIRVFESVLSEIGRR